MSTTRNPPLATVAVIAAAMASLGLHQASRGAEFYVAPSGRDSSFGTG
jgi:hypothetical protein